MHSRSRLFALFSVLIIAFSSRFALAQKKPSGPPARTGTPQQIILLLAGQSSSNKILLTLNNNRPSRLVADLTLHAVDGTPTHLPPITLDGGESRLVDFSRTLQASGITELLGYLEVDYTGQLAELGSQLTLYPVQGGGGLDSPRTLTPDYVSTDRHAVAWLPHKAEAVVALTNITNESIAVQLTLSGKLSSIMVPGDQTVLRKIDEEGEREDGSTISSDISYDGPVDAVRAFGYIRDAQAGSLPIRFYDSAGSTTSNISAVGLSTSRPTRIAIRNTSGSPVSFIAEFTEIGTDQPHKRNGPAIRLEPGRDTIVPVDRLLSQLREQNVERATLTIKTQALAGALIGSATQIVRQGLVEDIPLRTSNPPRYMRGFYPLRWDRDYTNEPMVANVSDHPMRVQAIVNAGSVAYTFPVQTVQPGSTLDFNVDVRRREQIPDINGAKIPLEATFGKFHWVPVLPAKDPSLLGRTELLSLTDNRASSFSCGGDCSPFVSVFGPYWNLDLSGAYPGPFISGARVSDWYELDYDEYGNPYQYPDGGTGWVTNNLSSGDTSIMSMGWSTSPVGDAMNTQNPGGTGMNYYFYEYAGVIYQDGSCELTDQGGDFGFPVSVPPTVTVSGPGIVLISGAGGTHDTAQLTATGYPSGGTYSWTSSNSNVTLSNQSTATVTATGAAGGASTLTVTYSLGGQSAVASQSITVQVPTSFPIISDQQNQANSCSTGFAGWTRLTTRQVTDQNGNPILKSGQSITESAVVGQNNLALPTSPTLGSANTDGSGTTGDHFYFCSSVCPSANTTTVTQTVMDGTYSLGNYNIVLSCSGITVTKQ